MNKSYIIEEVNNLRSFNIHELLYLNDIEVCETELLSNKKCDSQLIIANGIAGIYIKPNLNKYYRNFLLWHEFAHYLLHYKNNISYNFYLSRMKNKIEVDANTFAVLAILKGIDALYSYDNNIAYALIRNGVPESIAYQLSETLNINELY